MPTTQHIIFYTFNDTSTYLILHFFTVYTNGSYFYVKNAPVTQTSYLNQLFHIRALFGVIISCSTLNLPKIREKLAAGFTWGHSIFGIHRKICTRWKKIDILLKEMWYDMRVKMVHLHMYSFSLNIKPWKWVLKHLDDILVIPL